jgi:hypothetical protein
MNITRAELRAAVEEAHKRGMKITGHLCSVTYREAVDAGIDDLEHGFFVATDFVSDKEPDVCPGQAKGMAALAQVDTSDARFKALVSYLVAHHVAVTSTLTVFETFTPGQPEPPGLEVLDPILRDRFAHFRARVESNPQSVYRTLFDRARAMEVAFVRAGGLLVAGTDPTGGGVTSMRTGGNANGYGEIGIARAIERGEKPGPWMDATAPYLQGPGLDIGQMYELEDAADARRMVNFWADAGATSFKAYMNITRAELRAAVEEAHKRRSKITGHLCSVT